MERNRKTKDLTEKQTEKQINRQTGNHRVRKEGRDKTIDQL